LKVKHEQVLKLLQREQVDRRTDKEVLAQRRKELELQLAELDTKRRFVDEEMQKYIVQLSESVEAAARGFQVLGADPAA